MLKPADLSRITTPDGSLTAMRVGAGRDVLIIHSLLTDWTAFEPVLPWLTGRFRVTLANLPGFHGSAPVPAGIENYADRLVSAFDGFDLAGDAVVIANGFGGTVALAMALTQGHRFGKLILCDVAATFPLQGRKAFETMAGQVEKDGLASIATIAANRIFHASYLAAHRDAVEQRSRVLLGVRPEAFVAACRTLMTVDLLSELHAIRNPTLVLCGELDAATPPLLCQAVARNIPNARYVELPGCGHCPPLEQPNAFIRAISNFIGQ